MKKSFNSQQLQLISHCAGILRACNNIPFALANKINLCKIAVDHALKIIEGKIYLINERMTDETVVQSQKDTELVLKEIYKIDIIELNEVDFMSLDISGDKEVVQLDGTLKKFSYRDAYFNLLGMVIS